MLRIMMPEERNEIQSIDIVERPVLEIKQLLQVGFLVVHDEIVGSAIHQADQFFALIDDSHSLPPGQGSRPKTHDLDILLSAEQVRDRYRVVPDKLRPVVLRDLGVEEGFEVIDHFGLNSSGRSSSSEKIINTATFDCHLRKSLFQIIEEIINILYPYTQAQQIVYHTGFLALFFGDGSVGHGNRVVNKRFYAAQ